ncbi:hypothetical protein XENTR_v10018009 [Xenopus tropicalis]|uniref:Clarin 3 n=1 Tax=Xenopus tropicalis TaxID=8364 RepID=A0A803JIQ1_XENTR|nr:clarin-3 isoform X1 [Xenopus tropicalis]KAE8590301.1 hypothetical protein XENTR_v10018009 [Xenopus tropicalis]KAE8590302.1 hypothetical protein XENTR_v10018009 [Xenopus tropicalis]
MPSKQKTLLFLSGFVASIGSFAIVCTCLATTEWVSSKVDYRKDNSSGYVNIQYGLFQGTHAKIPLTAGLGSETIKFQVMDYVKDSSKIIQIVIILFLVLGLICSFLSSAITCLNSVSNPYLTYLGPIGVYVCVSLNAILSLLCMILCAANAEITGMPKQLAMTLDKAGDQFYKTRVSYGYSFWLLILIIALNFATVAVIYVYQQAKYTKQKEQERPMEKATQDVILF